MTCREFKHYAASLSLLEVTQMEDPQMFGHTQTCAACGSWMQKQRMLNASMHALRARTAGLEAGPSVERALLGVFRQGIPVGSMSASNAEVATGVKGPMETLRPHSKAAPCSTPFALRLSRVFEIGAYAAVAAAILIALFLGVHLLRLGPDKSIESKSAPERSAPTLQQQTSSARGAGAEVASGNSASRGARRREVRSTQSEVASLRNSERRTTGAAEAAAVADDSQSDAEAGYMALMLCDPLSCASDTQVIRMELPTSADQGAQPPMADMVVGYDGVVRAVRFVN